MFAVRWNSFVNTEELHNSTTASALPHRTKNLGTCPCLNMAILSHVPYSCDLAVPADSVCKWSRPAQAGRSLDIMVTWWHAVLGVYQWGSDLITANGYLYFFSVTVNGSVKRRTRKFISLPWYGGGGGRGNWMDGHPSSPLYFRGLITIVFTN